MSHPRLAGLLAIAAAAWLALPADAAILTAGPGSIHIRNIGSVKRAVIKLIATGKVAPAWTGNVAAGDAGTVSTAYQVATLEGVNIFRKLAGLQPVVFDTTLSVKCAQAALMMSANKQLNHAPPPTWAAYSAAGAEAAANSNLFLGFAGPFTIPGYIDDTGPGNQVVGHRRWILWSQSQVMGSGDIPTTGGFPPANALWVLPTAPTPAPTLRGGFVAWPYAGSIPNTLVFKHWSFSVPFADFSSARVSVKLGTKKIAARIVDRTPGVGDNTIVFEPKQAYTAADFGSYLYQAHLKAPHKLVIYTVTVSHVLLSTGATKTFKYRVKVFPM
jgi:hypothetical protein